VDNVSDGHRHYDAESSAAILARLAVEEAALGTRAAESTFRILQRGRSMSSQISYLGYPGGLLPAAVTRAAWFAALWLVLSGAKPAGLPAGAVAVVAATWTSLKLLPAGAWRLSPGALVGPLVRFLRQSVVAGADVAWRAFDPRLPLRPGVVTCPSRLAPGVARSAMCTLASLLPGTLPAGEDERGVLLIHCLDTNQPVTAQFAEDEAFLMRALGGRQDYG
jgi:multicomponent Na+:H+ antiporter subunit E